MEIDVRFMRSFISLLRLFTYVPEVIPIQSLRLGFSLSIRGLPFSVLFPFLLQIPP